MQPHPANTPTTSRVVSLVPSLTESLFDLGLGGLLVGVTDYCTRPAGQTLPLPKVGGPADARLADIIALRPDLVLAGREENARETVEALKREGIHTHVVFPRTYAECTAMLVELARLFNSNEAMEKATTLEITVEWQEAAARSRVPLRFFCPIWRENLPDGSRWWMTFNGDTYASSVLNLLGGSNAFRSRLRHYPLEADLGAVEPEPAGERDQRYPRVTDAEVSACGAEIVLLPDEPYPFTDGDAAGFCQQFPKLPACRAGRVYTLEGSLITWYGTRLARAIDLAGSIFDE